MSNSDAAARLDTFLDQVRRELGALSRAEADETIRELKSHVLDRTNGDLSAASLGPALEALGDPKELARLNAAARAAAEGSRSRSPWTILSTIGRLASVSFGATCACFISCVGYMIAGAWILAAVVKPFAPTHVGLWRLKEPHDTYSISLGVVSKAPAAVDLLGWWIIPVGLILGPLIGYLTFRYGRWSLRRLARRWSHRVA